MAAIGAAPMNKYWYTFWVWDLVPKDVDYILVYDSKLLPARPLPELPELKFAAAPDRADRIRQGTCHSDVIKRTGRYFQMHLFMAHRDTQPIFEALKLLHDSPKYNVGVGPQKDPRGADGRGHMTPLNEMIQENFDVYELPKTWNWIITYEKEFYTTEPYMINFHGEGTWAYWMYILHLFETMETGGIHP